MTIISNEEFMRQRVSKLDLVVNDLNTGGLKNPELVEQFFQLSIKEAKTLPLFTVKTMASHTLDIPKGRFEQQILNPGVEATALLSAQRSKPAFSKTTLEAKEYRGQVTISDEFFEDNVEEEDMRNTIEAMMREKVGLELEELAWNGDTASANPFLATLDGFRVQAVSNINNAAGSTTNKGVFKNVLKQMPSQYMRDRSRMMHFTSIDSKLDFEDSIGNRATQLGDQQFSPNLGRIYISGSEVVDVPVLPEDLGVGNNETQMIFCDPKNMALGIYRNRTFKSQADIVAGVIHLVVTLRIDYKYINEEAVIKTTSLVVG